MLAAMEKNPGSKNLGDDTMSPPKLEALGITKKQSSPLADGSQAG
jgi:hypothetical protein